MREPDYIVVRDSEWCDSGKWYDLGLLPTGPHPRLLGDEDGSVTFVATPFIEVREDGAVAQVYMRRTTDSGEGEA